MTLSSPARPYLDGKNLNKIEQNKAAKDGLLVGSAVSYTHLTLPTKRIV